jgi:glycosyltransferase involved in cell wall biosynthesis
LSRIFNDREHLLLYEPGDVNALAVALRWVRTEQQQAAEMARRGHDLVLAKYTWQAHADHLLDLFEAMLD